MSDGVEFYVYIYFDPETNVPFYVGKGQKHRARKHLHQCHNRLMAMKIKALKVAGLKPRIDILPMRSETDAFSMEDALISAIGRRIDETGPLFNVSDGGGLRTAGFAGRTHSAESRAKMSAARKGKPKSAEFKEKLRVVGLARDVSHLHSPESNEKRIKAQADPEYRKRMSDKIKQTVSPEHMARMTEKAALANTGRIESLETRVKKSIALTGRTQSPEARRKMSESHRRRHARTDH